MHARCPFCGQMTDPSKWLDCDKFYVATCKKCGKGYIVPKETPKPAD